MKVQKIIYDENYGAYFILGENRRGWGWGSSRGWGAYATEIIRTWKGMNVGWYLCLCRLIISWWAAKGYGPSSYLLPLSPHTCFHSLPSTKPRLFPTEVMDVTHQDLSLSPPLSLSLPCTVCPLPIMNFLNHPNLIRNQIQNSKMIIALEGESTVLKRFLFFIFIKSINSI